MAKKNDGLQMLLRGTGLGRRPVDEDVQEIEDQGVGEDSTSIHEHDSQTGSLPSRERDLQHEQTQEQEPPSSKEDTAADSVKTDEHYTGKKRGRKPKALSPEKPSDENSAKMSLSIPGHLWKKAEEVFTPIGRGRSGFVRDAIVVLLVNCGFSASELGTTSEEINLIKKRYSK